jgi:hypothetical protein
VRLEVAVDDGPLARVEEEHALRDVDGHAQPRFHAQLHLVIV